MAATALARSLSFPAAYREHCDLRQGLAALPRGSICEILGDSSTGRTALALSMLAAATARGEAAAVVDASDAFDPVSARNAGADLGKILWVQCEHRLENAFRAADLILHNGGFGLVVLDLCEVLPFALNRIPIPYWHRFRRTVEHTPSILLVLACQPVTQSCSARQFVLRQQSVQWRGTAPFQTMQSLAVDAVSRKPMESRPVRLEALAEG